MKLKWLGETEEPRDSLSSRDGELLKPRRYLAPHQIRLLGTAVGISCMLVVVVVVTTQSVVASRHEDPLLRTLLPRATTERSDEAEQVLVVIPKRAIEPGEALEESLFSLAARPVISIPEGTVRSFEELRGQFARTIIPADQPLNRAFLVDVRPTNEVAERIPDGFRAVTIEVDEITGVEGWARAGAHVDVAWVAEVNGAKTASIIVQNAKVLSAERRTDEGPRDAGLARPQPEVLPKLPVDAPALTTVTLLAAERDAQRISLASLSGTVFLLLRGLSDVGKQTSALGALTYRDLLQQREGAPDRVRGSVRFSERDGKGELVLLDDGMIVRKR